LQTPRKKRKKKKKGKLINSDSHPLTTPGQIRNLTTPGQVRTAKVLQAPGMLAYQKPKSSSHYARHVVEKTSRDYLPEELLQANEKLTQKARTLRSQCSHLLTTPGQVRNRQGFTGPQNVDSESQNHQDHLRRCSVYKPTKY